MTTDDRSAIFRVRAADLCRVGQHLFQRYPDREWGSFFRFGYRRTPWGVLVCFVDMLLPKPGDLDRDTPLTTFRDQYSRRAFHAATAPEGLALGVMHSHPAGFGTQPSPLDDDMDMYYAKELAAFGRGMPYCSLIFQQSRTRGLTFSGRVYDRGDWLPVESMIEIGSAVNRTQSELRPLKSTKTSDESKSTTARLQAVMGLESRERLEHSKVGIIGCSGTGSPAIETLSRAGVGEFVVVDPERLAHSNLERMHGSSWDHLQREEPPYKVEIVRDLILSINPSARVTPIAGNVLQANVVDHLVQCDILLGCTDTLHGRVALSDLAQHYLLPSFDVGVHMDGSLGRVTEQVVEINRLSCDLPCIYCRDKINPKQLTYELMSKQEREACERAAEEARLCGADADQYWHGRPRQLHTVGYLTTAAGALAAGYVEGVLTGTFCAPHPLFQFDVGRERFGFATPPVRQVEGCACHEHRGWADQARAYSNIAIPNHWPRRSAILPSLPFSDLEPCQTA